MYIFAHLNVNAKNIATRGVRLRLDFKNILKVN
jgi:hypothetical protein